jgi:DedD protein
VNSLLHREGDDDLDDMNGRQDREIQLGTTMILAIFFALAVLCAAFFGFGYSLGRKSVVPAAAVITEGQSGTVLPAGAKPTAGSAAPSGKQTQAVTPEISDEPDTDSAAKPRPQPAAANEPQNDDAPSEHAPAPAAPTPRAAAPVVAMPTTSATGTSVVQIAAVSHQEDADLLVTTLKRRGYNVAIRSEPQDKLLHVQVGPFASHKEADAMRQRLLADGFNAIVKDTK